MEKSKINKMEHSPILKLLVTMSLPAIISMLIQSMYNVVDSIFVGRIGEKALTAVSLAFPMQMLIIALAVGTGIGMNSLIARSLGAKDNQKANKVASYGIILGVMSGAIFAILGLCIAKPFFKFFTDDVEVVKMGSTYLRIIMLFSIGVFIQIIIEKIFQGSGNMLYPMLTQIMGAVINIALDPIFIFGLFGVPAMGVKGAAIATVSGQLSAMCLTMYLLIKRPKGVTVNFKNFKLEFGIIREIYKVGFPAILMQSIMAFLIVLLNNILIVFSQTSVAVLGIYFKLQSFIYMPVYGLCQGAMPIMGYSYGAKNKERLLKTLNLAIIFSLFMTIFGVILFILVPDRLIMLFSDTKDLIEIGVPALKIMSVGFVFAGISIIISIFFQAIGDGMKSLLISTTRQLFILLPMAIILSKIWGVTGVWVAFPLAEMIAIILSLGFFKFKYSKEIKYLGHIEK